MADIVSRPNRNQLSPTTDPSNLTVYGAIKLPTSESTIKFGDGTDTVVMSTDGNDYLELEQVQILLLMQLGLLKIL